MIFFILLQNFVFSALLLHMDRCKRLFLFAGYDHDAIIDDALIHYVSTLSKFGDVILCMDCECPKSEINKIKPFTIHTVAKRHGEYDFGSYKRAYQHARDKKILNKYDALYLVNDSVFGPMFDITNILNKIDSNTSDACGMVISKHKTHSFIESWFVRLNSKIFLTPWFNKFISSVAHESDKATITIKYEHGLTNIIKNHNCSWDAIYKIRGRFTYNNPKILFKRGCPFVKRACFTRHNGDCGNQIKYILNNSDTNTSNAILKTANRVYGETYMKQFLTYNLIKIYMRKIKYAIQKIKSGQI